MKATTKQGIAAPADCHHPIRAAIYVRISYDRTGAGLGVARQEEDCRALCARRGWEVVCVYCDNDVSAYSGKPRKEWRRLHADIATGRIDAIVCWHVDRLTRTPRELEDVIDLHDKSGIQLATATGEIDLATPTGRLVARTLGAAARHESEHKGERQRRAARQAAERGAPPRTGMRGYGYQLDKVTIIEAEAAIIREAARRVLAGEAVRAVARDLNERGIVTVTGKAWTTASLTTVLTAARISGRREYIPIETYNGGTRPRTGEITAEDAWPAIITPAQSDRLRALLTAPGRGATNGHGARTYLLSGVFHCGLCGHPMYGRVHNGKPRYQCIKEPGRPNCGKVAVYAHRADDEARDKILTALDGSPALLPALIRHHQADAATGDSEDAGAKLRQIDQRRDELAAAWAEGEISRKEWATAKRVLDASAEQHTRRLARSVHAQALAEFAAMEGDMWQRWAHPNMTDSARRAIIQACVTTVTVHPADGKRWNPDRIQPGQWLS
jgi:site-specific DNA recombinase